MPICIDWESVARNKTSERVTGPSQAESLSISLNTKKPEKIPLAPAWKAVIDVTLYFFKLLRDCFLFKWSVRVQYGVFYRFDPLIIRSLVIHYLVKLKMNNKFYLKYNIRNYQVLCVLYKYGIGYTSTGNTKLEFELVNLFSWWVT